MKAWMTFDLDPHEGVTLIHAETAGKAKFIALADFFSAEFLTMRAWRIPFLDDKPFTVENVRKADVFVEDLDDPDTLLKSYWVHYCNCALCRDARK